MKRHLWWLTLADQDCPLPAQLGWEAQPVALAALAAQQAVLGWEAQLAALDWEAPLGWEVQLAALAAQLGLEALAQQAALGWCLVVAAGWGPLHQLAPVSLLLVGPQSSPAGQAAPLLHCWVALWGVGHLA